MRGQPLLGRAIPVLLAVLLVAGLAAPARAADPGTGTVEGSLVNGTKDGVKAGSVEVTLVALRVGGEMSSRTTTASAEGHFSFTGLSTDPAYAYQARTVFLGADYYSEPFAFDGKEATRSVKITVYETTASDDAVRVAIVHTIVYPVDGGTQVERYFLIVNDADRSFVGSKDSGGRGETLRFSLPAGAVDPQYVLGLSSSGVVSTPDGFADTTPLTPEGREIAYSYRIPPGSGKFTIAEQVRYPTARFELLVGGDGIESRSDQLTARGKRDIKGMSFQQFSGGSFERGQTVSIQLSGLPGRTTPGFLVPAVAALAALAGVFGLVYLLKRRRARTAAAPASPDNLKERLLAQIAQLDDDLAAGAISANVHERLRAEKKAELVELMSGKTRRQAP